MERDKKNKRNNNETKEVKKNEKIINKKNKKNKKKHPKLRLAIKIFVILMLVLIISGVAAVVAIFKTDKWAITKEQLLVEAGATLYDKDGNEITSLTGDEINKKVTLSDMGKVPDAFVAIEDERFRQHKGIDVKRTLHAVLKFVTSGGKSSFGGSTITQQLVKITMKDDDRSGIAGVERKIREWSRAVQVEKMLSKDQILERYLNRIFLGSASNGLEVRGVEAAANYYFNKSAKDLSIAQSAFIAGINHAPNAYYPFSETNDNSEKIKTRTLNVLSKMHELNKISDEEYNAAVEETKNGLQFEKGSSSNGNSSLSYHAAAAINQIANELSDKEDINYSEAREMLINSGYKIYTTVDSDMQNKLKEIYENPKYIVKGYDRNHYSKKEDGQSAMVIIDHTTGYVVAEMGALGKNQDTLGLNRAKSARHGGSSFKPLVTVAPGLENKVITAATLFYDSKTSFGKYSPANDSNSYHGIINMRDVIRYSSNVPEVKLLSLMGLSASQKFLSSIGIDVNIDNAGLSMALGTISVSPLQMAAGYAAIANKGVYITPKFYTKVVEQNGNTIIETTQEKKRVMSEDNAYIESTILRGPVSAGGTASRYSRYLGNMDVAGKTGTSDGGVDRWFCGFTPYYTAACWYGADNGYNYDGKGNRISFYPSVGNPAAYIWFPAMKAIHTGLDAKSFEKPSTIVNVTICKKTGKKATDKCTETYTEIFSKENIPSECDGHQTVTICKESGKIATEFCTDTENKTYGVVIDTEKKATWSPKQEAEQPPTETCDIHKEAAKIEVPNVVGKDEETAKTLLKNAGFKVKVLKDNDKTKKKGIVLKQNATTASKGAEITITVNQYDGGKEGPDKNVINNNTTVKNDVVKNNVIKNNDTVVNDNTVADDRD